VRSFDVILAAESLAAEEDAADALAVQKAALAAAGWDEGAAGAALKECAGNMTAAVELLETEESALHDNFESAVKDMTDNGCV
jgi:hypothetical protein